MVANEVSEMEQPTQPIIHVKVAQRVQTITRQFRKAFDQDLGCVALRPAQSRLFSRPLQDAFDGAIPKLGEPAPEVQIATLRVAIQRSEIRRVGVAWMIGDRSA